MDSDRWRLISRLYHDALGVRADSRARFLAEACPEDAALRASVLSLVSHFGAENILDASAAHCDSTILEPRGSVARGHGASDFTDIASDRSRPDQTRFSPGQLIASRYRIVRPLGQGGMGEVYQADDLTLGERVALKLVTPALDHLPYAIERFTTEVRLARAIAHPNICRVYDIGEFDGSRYLSMEYVDGETVSSLLQRVGALSPEVVADIARQVCAGLAAAHARGVLHRDLKPANIMIDGQGYVRILDFGLAVRSTSSHNLEVAGTPAYMAPEQLVGGPVSERTDLFALGLLIQQLLTGRPPWQSNDLQQVDERFLPIIRRCLAFDPTDRPTSAMEVASALPGKDIIETAIDAGRTLPAPIIAAAGASRGLSRKVGATLLASALTGAIGVAGIASRLTLGAVQLPQSPSALAAQARSLLQAVAPEARVVDNDYWFDTASSEPRVRFVYRQSSTPLVPRNIFRSVTIDDPPGDANGMGTVTLSVEGRLRLLKVMSDGSSVPARSEPDWPALFQAAGFNLEQFVRAAPDAEPLVPHDEVISWKPEPTRLLSDTRELPSVVTAALLRRVLTLFSTEPPSPGNIGPDLLDTRRGKGLEAALVMLIVLGFLSAAVLARRHIRRHEADQQGAGRVAFAIAAAGIVMVITRGHHVADGLSEWFFVLGASGWALIWAAFSWLTYVGLEPYARRWWPNTLASWTSVLEGRVWEPIVGRDLLIGLNAGFVTVALRALRFHLTSASIPDLNLRGALESVGSWSHWVAALAFCVSDALEFAIGGLFVLVLLRLLLRRSWPAVLLSMCLVMPIAFGAFSLHAGALPWDIVFTLMIGALAAVIFLRVGLLAAFAMIAVEHLSTELILTLDPRVWYFRYSIIVVLGFVALSTMSYLAACTIHHLPENRLGSVSTQRFGAR